MTGRTAPEGTKGGNDRMRGGTGRDLDDLVALVSEAVELGRDSFSVAGTASSVEAVTWNGSLETRMRSAPTTPEALTALVRSVRSVLDPEPTPDGAGGPYGVLIGLVDLGSLVPRLPGPVAQVRLRVSTRAGSDGARLDVQVLLGPDPSAAVGVTTVRALEVLLSRVRMDPQTERAMRSQLAWHREIAAGAAATKEGSR